MSKENEVKKARAWCFTGVAASDVPFNQPRLKTGQCLIKVEAAPVNPSDEMYVRGQYGLQPTVDEVIGFEGCGTVIAANAGPYGWWLKGKRVVFTGGTWATYAVVSMFDCIPISKELPTAAAATMLVNPMSAMGLVARAKKLRTRAIVMNAAGSELGRFILAECRKKGLRLIGTVRREETVERLKRDGFDEVLVTTDANYLDKLSTLSHDLSAKVMFDAVASPASGQEFAALVL